MKNTLEVTSITGETFYLEEVTAPKQAARINAKDRTTYRELWECYGRYSDAKRNAYDYCKRLCFACGGSNLRIVAAGVQTFSVKFDFCHPDNGACCTAYITRDYNRYAYN